MPPGRAASLHPASIRQSHRRDICAECNSSAVRVTMEQEVIMLMARLAWMVIAVGLGGCSKAATGSESGACYGNGTCNPGLTCLSNVCVNAGSDAAVAA